MNRGSKCARETNPRQTNRFNEAPIHESGKSRRHGSTRVNQFGFNEAPIHESGK